MELLSIFGLPNDYLITEPDNKTMSYGSES
jgi:hypothetical protein